ncbi:MAG: hypothetical protein Fur0034_03190 [Desulfuromonadia bacterium]
MFDARVNLPILRVRGYPVEQVDDGTGLAESVHEGGHPTRRHDSRIGDDKDGVDPIGAAYTRQVKRCTSSEK